jgi:hypothetical protein
MNYVWNSNDSEYKSYCLLGYDAVYFVRSIATFCFFYSHWGPLKMQAANVYENFCMPTNMRNVNP